MWILHENYSLTICDLQSTPRNMLEDKSTSLHRHSALLILVQNPYKQVWCVLSKTSHCQFNTRSCTLSMIYRPKHYCKKSVECSFWGQLQHICKTNCDKHSVSHLPLHYNCVPQSSLNWQSHSQTLETVSTSTVCHLYSVYQTKLSAYSVPIRNFSKSIVQKWFISMMLTIYAYYGVTSTKARLCNKCTNRGHELMPRPLSESLQFIQRGRTWVYMSMSLPKKKSAHSLRSFVDSVWQHASIVNVGHFSLRLSAMILEDVARNTSWINPVWHLKSHIRVLRWAQHKLDMN